MIAFEFGAHLARRGKGIGRAGPIRRSGPGRPEDGYGD
jgi:hypothetical protein